MDVMNKEQAKIAEEAGACAVMALERGSACAETCPRTFALPNHHKASCG